MDRLPALSDARSSLLAAFTPTPIEANFSASQVDLVGELFREMTLVERAGAWRALSALSGQMLELHIRQFMIQGGVTRSRAEKMTLATLLSFAEERGLLAVRKPGVSTLQSMSTARRLRNMASHGSPSQRGPTELRATQSLVLLVALSARLFPPQRPTFLVPGQVSLEWLRAHSAETDPELLTRFVGENPQQVDEELLRSVFQQVSRHGTLLSVYKLGNKLRNYQRTLVQELLSQCFGDVAIRGGLGQPLIVAKVVRLFMNCSLRGQARALGVLMPMDADALSYCIVNAPASVASYIFLCDRTDGQLFRDAFGRPEDVARASEVLVRHAGRLLRHKGHDVPNFAKMLNALPVNLRTAFFRDMPRGDLLEEMQGKTAADCLVLAGVAKGVETEQAEMIADDLLRLAALRVADEPFASLCRLLWTLEGSPVLASSEARLAIGKLISHCLMPEHFEDAPYVLWRIARLGSFFETKAMSAVTEIESRAGLPLGVQVRIKALRTLNGDRGSLLVGSTDQSDVTPRTDGKGFDRWDLFLLVVGFRALGLEEQRAKIASYINPDWFHAFVRGELSRRLMNAAADACKPS
ncbi:hypothetical protein ACFUIY_10270 [Streptomyces griseorubiginosus]|uniref:hypothetical protein n=1 Tax=Streptomyces griseorubiginosus TaxID=67304 RepID=UPI00363633EB